jgi:hypothetical protein
MSQKINTYLRSIAVTFVVLLSLLLNLAPSARACGPFTSTPVFSYNKHPDYPLTAFAAGDLGVLKPRYARSYLTVAYRYLSGGTLSPDEQKGVVALWEERNGNFYENNDRQALSDWLAARKKLAGGEDPNIEIYRAVGGEAYDSFINCNGSSFETATRALNERAAKYGATNAHVKDWLTAQDRVFSNCGDGNNPPADAPADAPAWLKQDRAYQTAAAQFYAKNYDDARAQFKAVANDRNSPWREAAALLEARSLIRKAALAGADAERRAALTEADANLKSLAASRSEYQKSAQRLSNLVAYRLRPAARLRELSGAVLRSNDNLKQDLWDYTLLLDKLEDPQEGNAKPDPALVEAKNADDLSAWLFAFQGGDKNAVSRWQQKNSLPWLLAALAQVQPQAAEAAALLRAADAVAPASPAYATANFHAARILNGQGQAAAARAKLDTVLAARLPVSARNDLLEQRMAASANLEEFLRFAQRQPSAYSLDEDGREIPDEEPKEPEERAKLRQSLFDGDAANAFNLSLPAGLLREAALRKSLPPNLRRRVALAAWTKAALLDSAVNANSVGPVLAELMPALKPLLDEYAAAPTAPERKAIAVYLFLKYPSTRPYVDAGAGRETPDAEIDSYRDNWWCEKPFAYNAPPSEDGSAPQALPPPSLPFLTAAQKAEAKAENARLQALGTAPNYLSQQAVAWAARDPNNPRVPEALHLAVKSTRYGCANSDTGRNSKAAYDLLKKNYPKTEWAQKTKYWYKGTE